MNIRSLFILSLLLLTRHSFSGEGQPEEIKRDDTTHENLANAMAHDGPILRGIVRSAQKLKSTELSLDATTPDGINHTVTIKKAQSPTTSKKQPEGNESQNNSEKIVELPEPGKPSFISKLWGKCTSALGKGTIVITSEAQKRPKSSLAVLGAALGSAALYSYHTSPEIKRIIRKKIEDAQEKANDHYYDILDQYLMPIFCEWKDMEDEAFTAKDAVYVGAGLSALYGASKLNESYGISLAAREKIKQHMPFVKKHAEALKSHGAVIFDTIKNFWQRKYQENTTAAHCLAGSLATIAGSYVVYKLLKHGNQSFTKLLEDFWDTMSEDQNEKINDEFIELMINSRSNPLSLQVPEFVDILSDQQIDLLNKVIEQFTQEKEFSRN